MVGCDYKLVYIFYMDNDKQNILPQINIYLFIFLLQKFQHMT